MLIAKNSDVKIATAESLFPSSRSLCLPSENKSVAPVGISISMSPAIVDLVKSWFEDFEKRLVTVDKVKLKSFFKSVVIKPSTRPYASNSDSICSEPLANPPSFFNWLPMPERKLEIHENDFISIERSTRATVRTLNFVEAALQLWHRMKGDPQVVSEIMINLSKATKAMIQLQIGLLCNIVVARRDHF